MPSHTGFAPAEDPKVETSDARFRRLLAESKEAGHGYLGDPADVRKDALRTHKIWNDLRERANKLVSRRRAKKSA